VHLPDGLKVLELEIGTGDKGYMIAGSDDTGDAPRVWVHEGVAVSCMFIQDDADDDDAAPPAPDFMSDLRSLLDKTCAYIEKDTNSAYNAAVVVVFDGRSSPAEASFIGADVLVIGQRRFMVFRSAVTTVTRNPCSVLVWSIDDRDVLIQQHVTKNGGWNLVCSLRVPEPDASGVILPRDVLTLSDQTQAVLLAESMSACHEKVHAFARSVRKEGSEIPGRFEKVYLTSDIHADLRKFVHVLLALGLVRLDGGRDLSDVYDAVWKLVWTAKGTLLVICGDLVDGKCGDEAGSFEFLLHALIFNLRIQARKMGSEIRFTIGNHDSSTVTARGKTGLYGYVAPEHWKFAPFVVAEPSSANRARMLAPFYKCSPFLILTLGRAAFVHGGFLASDLDEAGIYARTVALQAKIDAETDIEAVLQHTTGVEGGDRDKGVLWARGYASNASVCTEEHVPFDFVAVGHCVTHDQSVPTLAGLYKDQCKDSVVKTAQIGKGNMSDSSIGCVVTRRCEKGGPLIALVDTGMSLEFRMQEKDKAKQEARKDMNLERPIGMIVLSKENMGSSLGTVDGYTIHRIRVGRRGYYVVDESGSEHKTAWGSYL
jgi:hypothetical protein